MGRRGLSLFVFSAAVFALASCAGVFNASKQKPLRLEEISFGDLDGWSASDPRPALEALARSCASRSKHDDSEALGGAGYGGRAGDWKAACTGAAKKFADAAAARSYFEASFVPYRISAGRDQEGLFTGYYEPLLRGSRTLHGAYKTPIYGVPADLVTADLGLFKDNLKGQRISGRIENGQLVPYLTRGEIARFGLANAATIVYVDDPVDAFFLHVQGSGRIRLDDGTWLRAAYAGQNGHPYQAIGKVLADNGAIPRDEVSMQSIRAWLNKHPRDMQRVFDANPSYVFFAEKPLGDPRLGAEGAEGVALTPGVSLAVDRGIHALGVPVWLETTAPDTNVKKPDHEFRQLMVAQDTGGAIIGPVRGDVYWGFGNDAASIAGRMKSKGRMVILLPKEVAAHVGERAEYSGPDS